MKLRKKLMVSMAILSSLFTLNALPVMASENISKEDYAQEKFFCKHSYTNIYKYEVDRDCTSIIYNYTETCVSCNKKIKGGTVREQLSTPNHSIRTLSHSCDGRNHWYERKCIRCGYVEDGFSLSCNGNCIEVSSEVFN